MTGDPATTAVSLRYHSSSARHSPLTMTHDNIASKNGDLVVVIVVVMSRMAKNTTITTVRS